MALLIERILRADEANPAAPACHALCAGGAVVFPRSSEVGVVALATPDIVSQVPHSAGRVTPGARLELMSEDGAPVPAGTRGEIRVATDDMPAGYHGADAGTPGFRDGWFYPRDRGYLSAEGFLFVEGRIDDILNVGGRKIAPEFLESMLREHPRVREAGARRVGRIPRRSGSGPKATSRSGGTLRRAPAA